ncbi:NAD(P)H-dependent oxidoreductase [Saccharibacillus sp. JS10]|uniref:NAD(P)H-dependent oxidoreductase n=1 Tax=Saccharibacillus sp. JS10 TaxID=2950552 RepID=UPI00210C19D9|nr:NAD(P)H-dependent oxidoreductase [Saccharibacillus sp. JS10]MCQ4087924.1 NAD(P)H-dependent oxidoreductase [Saccharibacillus sp. JS10]
MNLLLIYVHPNHKSLSHSFMEEVLKGSEGNPGVDEVRVVDLYEENFNPVLVFNEDKKRRDMHRDPELARYRELLTWANKIVFVYPIWWGRPPAMLMGFIDRMFASNFAYRDKGTLLPEGLLKGKSVVCISVMKGPTGYLQWWLGNVHQILMRKTLFNYVGIRHVKFFEFGNMESSKGRHSQKLNKIYRYFKAVNA